MSVRAVEARSTGIIPVLSEDFSRFPKCRLSSVTHSDLKHDPGLMHTHSGWVRLVLINFTCTGNPIKRRNSSCQVCLS